MLILLTPIQRQNLGAGDMRFLSHIQKASRACSRYAVNSDLGTTSPNSIQWLFWSIIFYNISLCATKMSILLQYRRIFAVTEMRIPLAILMAFIVSWGLVAFLIKVFSCNPVSAYWDVSKKPTAHCLENNR